MPDDRPPFLAAFAFFLVVGWWATTLVAGVTALPDTVGWSAGASLWLVGVSALVGLLVARGRWAQRLAAGLVLVPVAVVHHRAEAGQAAQERVADLGAVAQGAVLAKRALGGVQHLVQVVVADVHGALHAVVQRRRVARHAARGVVPGGKTSPFRVNIERIGPPRSPNTDERVQLIRFGSSDQLQDQLGFSHATLSRCSRQRCGNIVGEFDRGHVPKCRTGRRRVGLGNARVGADQERCRHPDESCFASSTAF